MKARILVAVVVAAVGLGLVGWLLLPKGNTVREADARNAVVQVNTEGGNGTGFFVEGPDEWAYIATAFHVVEGGHPVTIARVIKSDQHKDHIVAYPEAEIAAYDANSDLAIIRLRNVKATQFEALPLALSSSVTVGNIVSYGFAALPNKPRGALGTQPGSIIRTNKFPVKDPRTGMEMPNKPPIDGIEIGANLSLGYDGGPTCNEHGEVVGVNTTKARTGTEYNGAIVVEKLRELLKKTKPLEKRAPPTREEVKQLLKNIMDQYLRLPMEERLKYREDRFIALSDMPKLQNFTTLVRRMEQQITPIDVELSKTADFNLQLVGQTGLSLETYHDEGVQSELALCEKYLTVRNLFKPLIDETEVDKRKRADEAKADKTQLAIREAAPHELANQCDNRAVRPIAWDLTAMTLKWDSSNLSQQEFNITQVDLMNDGAEPEYSATITPSGMGTSFNVWIRWEGMDLKLKLFDSEDELYGLRTTRTVSSDPLHGEWSRSRPRSSMKVYGPTVHLQYEETLSVSSGTSDKEVILRHVVKAQVFGLPAKLKCRREPISGIMEQNFDGKLEQVGAVLKKSKKADVRAPDFDACRLRFDAFYKPTVAMTLKNQGEKLLVYRTSGEEFPEKVVFERVKKP